MTRKINYVKRSNIEYFKESTGEVTKRTVIFTSTPPKSLMALDVTGLSEDEQEALQNKYQEYQDYLAQQNANVFSFEDFVEHTTNKTPNLKWRRFFIEDTKFLDEAV